MHVTVNGEAHEIPEALTVRGLVEHLALTGGPVAVGTDDAGLRPRCCGHWTARAR